ncbi:hypothetical protein FN846DRAFT_995120 [Sphaerosporella brunnea]|uniref:Uncharacterized protein n=1 Tax=Sphaerosporella brunnea TaxID=1250544 RepID=A0A5J5EJM5_9PEZI|nr:hypothetical protein FN846DRAFT_995120 [Sphaerosporella brunnea]
MTPPNPAPRCIPRCPVPPRRTRRPVHSTIPDCSESQKRAESTAPHPTRFCGKQTASPRRWDRHVPRRGVFILRVKIFAVDLSAFRCLARGLQELLLPIRKQLAQGVAQALQNPVVRCHVRYQRLVSPHRADTYHFPFGAHSSAVCPRRAKQHTRQNCFNGTIPAPDRAPRGRLVLVLPAATTADPEPPLQDLPTVAKRADNPMEGSGRGDARRGQAEAEDQYGGQGPTG